MLTLRPGSQAGRLAEMLSVTGEFPLRSLHLLGSERSFRDLVRRLSVSQLIRHPEKDVQLKTRMLQLSGSGHSKSIRFYKGALPLLDWIHPEAYRYYMDAFWGHHFPGDAAHRDRNHRVAEAVALCAWAGLEVVPYRLPALQMDCICQRVPDMPAFYLARDMKKIRSSEQNKTMFTRITGAIFSPGGCYAVYNTRSAAMRWNGLGEFKALHSLTEVARMNAGATKVDSAVLLGESGEIALATLQESEKSRRPEFRFDGIYHHVYFIPLNHTGARQLRLLLLPDWKERILDLLFDPDTRTYGTDSMECDACVDGAFILSHLDGDLARLLRFREAMYMRPGRYEVLCFPHQAQLLREYLDTQVSIKTLEMSLVEKELGLEGGLDE